MKMSISFRQKRKVAKLRRQLFSPTEQLFSLPRHWKQSGLLALDLCFIPFAFWLALVARLGGLSYEFQIVDLLAIMLTMVFSAAFL